MWCIHACPIMHPTLHRILMSKHQNTKDTAYIILAFEAVYVELMFSPDITNHQCG